MPYKSKCFSSCRGIPEDKCKTRRCSYANGEKLSYCRISKLYKINKNTCKMVPKIKKSIQGKIYAVNRIKSAYKKYKNKNKTDDKKDTSSTMLSKSMARKIEATNKKQRFFKRTTQKRQSEFLKAICPDAGSCLAFGRENIKIYNFFHGFVMTDYMKGNLTRLGKPSSNGFVYSIEYKKRNYNASAILKSSQREESDNLAYEYMVGQFINSIMHKYPCFVETYGLYQYTSEFNWKNMKDSQKVSSSNFSKVANLISTFDYKIDYKNLCMNSKYLAVLIQSIKNPSGDTHTMNDLLKLKSFILNDCISSYYQIYFVLSAIRNVFTHYDLHNDNIMLYKPDENGYIKYHYELNDGTITSFRSSYVVKIIDYGRSFFNDVGEISSKDIQNELCREDECIDKCGDEVGFQFMNPVTTRIQLQQDYFINSSIVNVSHDLRGLTSVLQYTFDIDEDDPDEMDKVGDFIDGLAGIKYGVGIQDVKEKHFGTIENTMSGLPRAVHNVKDAEKWLRGIINTPTVKAHNMNLYSPLKGKFKMGDMYIYETKGNCRFVPSK